MWRDSVNCNDLIAELRNTWMRKPHNPEADCVLPTQGTVSPEDRHCRSFQSCAPSPRWLHDQGTLPTCEYLPPVTGMLTELSRCCMGTACGQMFGTGTGLGLQRWNCWSPAKSWSQNRRVLTACFTKPELNKCQSRRCLMDCPAHWWFHFRASGCVQLGGIERQCASVFVSVVLLLSHPNSRALSLAICMSERQDQI